MKQNRTGRAGWTLALLAAAWLAFAPHAAAAGGTAQDVGTVAKDVGTLLAPLLAAATGIERILEMFWNLIENFFRQIIAGFGLGRSWANYARDQVAAAEKALDGLAVQASALAHRTDMPDPLEHLPGVDLADRIDRAQQKLADAQQQLQSALKAPRYTSTKQAISLLASVGLGLVLALNVKLDMFQLLGLATTKNEFQEFITGLVIGAGTGPVHSIINLLQQSQDTVGQAANVLRSRSRQNVSQSIATLFQTNLAAGEAAESASAAPSAPEAATRGMLPPGTGAAPQAPVAPAPPPRVTQEQLRTLDRLANR